MVPVKPLSVKWSVLRWNLKAQESNGHCLKGQSRIKKRAEHWVNLCQQFLLESCAPGLTSWNLLFSFFPLYKNHTLLFSLPCSPVCKPEAVCQGIAIRAKVEQKGMVIFLYWEKNKNFQLVNLGSLYLIIVTQSVLHYYLHFRASGVDSQSNLNIQLSLEIKWCFSLV